MDDQTQPAAAGAAMSFAKKARMYELLAEHEQVHGDGKRLPHDDARELHDLIAQDPERDLMLPGRIPMTEAEHATVDKLVAKHGDAVAGMTRRDAGETGPLLVHVGADTYEIDAAGKQKKVA